VTTRPDPRQASRLDPESPQSSEGLAHERGIAIFLSSHLLSEVEQTCDRVAILHRGRMLALDRVDRLLQSRSRVRFRTPMPKAAVSALRRHAAGEPEADGDVAVFADMAEDEIPRALTTLSAEGIPVFEVVRTRPALEELFLELTLRPYDGDKMIVPRQRDVEDLPAALSRIVLILVCLLR
jgi:ABC-2 type transport system ATP-binding protein